MRAMLIALMTLASSIAAADAPRPKVLVLPLAESQAIDAGIARTFDARLLVALEDSKRIQVITHDEELECTTMKCLAATGVELGVAYVLSLAVVREDAGLTVFGALIDVKTATAWRRIELPRVNPATLSKSAPGELVPQILGITAKTAVLGFSLATGEALTATQEIQDQITAMRAFKVIPLGGNDRSALTHRADITLTELSIEEPRRHLCRWLDGKLVGTFAVTELATGQVVFTKTVTIEASRRAHFSSRTEISQLLIDRAVADWMTAFRASGGIKPRR